MKRSVRDDRDVGETASGDGPTKPLILRWNGTIWKQMPSVSPSIYGGLTGMAATSADNAWAAASPATAATATSRPCDPAVERHHLEVTRSLGPGR
jgi:hypothetical protein